MVKIYFNSLNYYDTLNNQKLVIWELIKKEKLIWNIPSEGRGGSDKLNLQHFNKTLIIFFVIPFNDTVFHTVGIWIFAQLGNG